jgi:hypothetical protein
MLMGAIGEKTVYGRLKEKNMWMIKFRLQQ